MAAEGQEWSQSQDAQRLSGWHREAEKRLGVGQGKSRMGLESILEQLLGAWCRRGCKALLAEPVVDRLESSHGCISPAARLSFSLQVLPAPCLLLRPAGRAPLPRGTEPAPRRPPGGGSCLQ